MVCFRVTGKQLQIIKKRKHIKVNRTGVPKSTSKNSKILPYIRWSKKKFFIREVPTPPQKGHPEHGFFSIFRKPFRVKSWNLLHCISFLCWVRFCIQNLRNSNRPNFIRGLMVKIIQFFNGKFFQINIKICHWFTLLDSVGAGCYFHLWSPRKAHLCLRFLRSECRIWFNTKRIYSVPNSKILLSMVSKLLRKNHLQSAPFGGA